MLYRSSYLSSIIKIIRGISTSTRAVEMRCTAESCEWLIYFLKLTNNYISFQRLLTPTLSTLQEKKRNDLTNLFLPLPSSCSFYIGQFHLSEETFFNSPQAPKHSTELLLPGIPTKSHPYFVYSTFCLHILTANSHVHISSAVAWNLIVIKPKPHSFSDLAPIFIISL